MLQAGLVTSVARAAHDEELLYKVQAEDGYIQDCDSSERYIFQLVAGFSAWATISRDLGPGGLEHWKT